jgi:hypothetical protein
VAAKGWDKPLIGLHAQMKKKFDAEAQAMAFYALKRFQDDTPVGNPDRWKNPKSAPKGYVGGSLRQSFTAERERGGWNIFSQLPYAVPIWVEGHSTLLGAGAVDLIIADLTNRI